MPSIFEQLEKILEDTDDYLSHDSALYFNGLEENLPQKIIIVTSSRRRNRHTDNYQIDFVYHHSRRPRETRLVQRHGAEIRIAKLSQALVDIVSDCCQSEEIDYLARIFWHLPYNASEAVGLASRTSNTALKRILFWALWAGRLQFSDIPQKLERTPVNLLQNSQDTQIWESNLKLFYPKPLPGMKLQPPNVSLPEDLNDWNRLRCNPRFSEFAMQAEWLPIAGDPTSKSVDLLKSFFAQELSQIVAEDITLLLEHIHGQAADQKSMPQQFFNWLNESSNFVERYSKELEEWVSEKLQGDNPAHWEIAFFYAPLTGKVEETFKRIAASAPIIFNSGRFRGIKELCRHAEEHNTSVPRSMRILLSRIFARQNLFEEALSEISKASQGSISERERIDVAFTAGIINRQAGRFEESIKLLNDAATLASKAELHESAGAILLSIGNVYLSQGELMQARKNYLRSYSIYPRNSSAPIIANIQTNLGLVEFRSGNLKKADSFFSHAVKNQQLNSNFQGVINSRIMLGRIKLARGRMLEALKELTEIEQQLAKMSANADRKEILAIIAWTYELAGRPNVSEKYLEKAELETVALTASAEFYLILLQALRHLIRNELESAETFFAKTISFGTEANIPANDIAFAEFYRALCVHLQNRNEALSLFQRLPLTVLHKSDHPFHLFVRIYLGLSFPGVFPNVDINNSLARLNLTDYYEPAWIFIAEQIFAYGSASAVEMIKNHMNKVLPDSQKLYEQRFPRLQKLLKKLGRSNLARKTFTLIKNGKHTVVNEEKYHEFLAESPQGTLLFNGITGKLAFSAKHTHLKPGSILFRILVCLLSALPEEVSLETLYEMVWGGKYEPEYGQMALKAAILRLRKNLLKICPNSRIEVSVAHGSYRIILEAPFAAII